MNVMPVVLLVTFFLSLVYLRLVAPRQLLRRLDARPMDKGPVWRNVRERMLDMARRHRVAPPRLWVLPEFAPNALVLRPLRGPLHVAVTEGLVRALSADELDAALSLCLTHGYQKRRWWQTWSAALLYPLGYWVQGLPLPAQLLFTPVLSFVVGLGVRYSQYFKADREASNFHSTWRIASTLQKLSVLGKKIPLRRWNLALDFLFLVSPLSLDETPLWSFIAQPTMDLRRDRLLTQPACESTPSLP